MNHTTSMKSRINLVSIASLILPVAMLAGATFTTRAHWETVTSQGQDRIVVIPSGQDPPLRMKLVKTKRGVIDADKKLVQKMLFSSWTAMVTAQLMMAQSFLGIEHHGLPQQLHTDS